MIHRRHRSLGARAAGQAVNWAELSQRLNVVVGQHDKKLKGLIYCAEDDPPLVNNGVERAFHTRRALSARRAPTIMIIGDVGARSAIERIAQALRGSVAEYGSATLDEVA